MSKLDKFLPTTKEEMKQRGWDELDVVLITGDAYIDSPPEFLIGHPNFHFE